MEKLTLIKGSFDAEDASEILLNLFSSKLQFHSLKNFSSMERFGVEDPISAQRIPELKKTLGLIEKILADAKRSNLRLSLHADVIVELQPNDSL